MLSFTAALFCRDRRDPQFSADAAQAPDRQYRGRMETSRRHERDAATVQGPRRLFISYARRDAPAVNDLHRDLARADHQVWLDRKLEGGQRWWDEILKEIQKCE